MTKERAETKRKATRGAQGGGSIRKRKDGSWEARYTVGRDPGSGKQIQKSVYGKTQTEVRKKLQQATTAIDSGLYTEPSKLTVFQWCDIWIKEYTKHLKPRTVMEYESQVRTHIKPSLGAVRLQELKPHTVQAFYNKLIDGWDGKPGLSPKTVKNIHGVLHKALSQAMELGYIQNNASGACKLPRIEKADITPLDEKQIALFLEAIKGNPYERVFLVDVFTGLRKSEILGLTWDCVDFDKGTIYVYRQLQRVKKEYKFGTLKNNKTRMITPASDIMQILREQRKSQIEWRLKAGKTWQPWQSYELVFSNEIGGHLVHQTVYKNFKRIMQIIGAPSTRFHDLRHTYAVISLQSGDDVKTVQENLGHHTAAFTLDQYGHVTERMKQESANRMQSFINSVKGKAKGK